jgi:hypothetical protein
MTVIVAEPSIDVGALLRRLRIPAVITVIALAFITVLAAIGATPHDQPLDPRNTAPNGTHALAALLGDRGVTVAIATTMSQLDPNTAATVMLTDPDAIPIRALRTIAGSSATIVVIDPGRAALSALGSDAVPDLRGAAVTLEPRCGLPAAVIAGSVRLSGEFYRAPGTSRRCYPTGGDAALVSTTRGDGARTIVLGSPSTLTNAELANSGDAALTLGLLDRGPLRWVPGGLRLAAPPKSQQGLFNLLPPRLIAAVAQLFVALLVLALWRARRLGKPVAEPLPVIVRAAETVEGRARLMRAARARDAAARALRAASIQRLAHALRLGVDDDPAAVVGVIAERTHTPATEVHAVLYGGEPPDDASLVRLAQQLPDLEAAVRHDDSPTGGQF